jgi:hypothetical protein
MDDSRPIPRLLLWPVRSPVMRRLPALREAHDPLSTLRRQARILVQISPGSSEAR